MRSGPRRILQQDERLASMNDPMATNFPTTKQHRWIYWTGLVVMAIFYILAGINHFVHPAMYIAIVPPYLPSPSGLVLISGVAEILGGIGVLIPDGLVFKRTRAFSAWGIVLMLIAFLLVHINMCLHPNQFPAVPLLVIWLRLPLQIPLIAWAWYYTRR
jgi:uncharacterized membrane protein